GSAGVRGGQHRGGPGGAAGTRGERAPGGAWPGLGPAVEHNFVYLANAAGTGACEPAGRSRWHLLVWEGTEAGGTWRACVLGAADRWAARAPGGPGPGGRPAPPGAPRAPPAGARAGGGAPARPSPPSGARRV